MYKLILYICGLMGSLLIIVSCYFYIKEEEKLEISYISFLLGLLAIIYMIIGLNL